MYQVEYVPSVLAGLFGTLYSVGEAEWPVPNGGDETVDGIGDVVGVSRMEVSEASKRDFSPSVPKAWRLSNSFFSPINDDAKKQVCLK